MDTVMIIRTSNNDACLYSTMGKRFVVFHLPPRDATVPWMT
jgi:hypothetical protein